MDTKLTSLRTSGSIGKAIGLWMYQNDNGTIPHDKLCDELHAHGFDVVTGFDMRRCFVMDGRVYTEGGFDLSSLSAFFHMNADEQNDFQNDVLRALEQSGVAVVNEFSAFARCKDKFRANQILRDVGIAVPRAALLSASAPRALFSNLLVSWGALLVKPRKGHGASGIVKYDSAEALWDFVLATRHIFHDYYLEEFIDFGDIDYRVEVFDGRALGGYSRRRSHSFKTNICSGGDMVGLPPNAEQEETAVRAAKELGITGTIVDMVRRKSDDKLFVLEVNPLLGIFVESAMRAGTRMSPRAADPLYSFDQKKIDAIVNYLVSICLPFQSAPLLNLDDRAHSYLYAGAL